MHRHIGIYPGTFDPVHEGHIDFAKEAAELFHLEKVVFLPERNPRRKVGVSDISKRHAILSASLQSEPKLDCHVLETDQFTILDTLPKLHQLFPRAQFTFLLGSDVALHLPNWENLPQLLADVSFLVAIRKDNSESEIEDIFQTLKTPARYTIIDSPRPDAQSSTIRKG